jgi:hypothetical protein
VSSELGCERKLPWPNLRYCSGICMVGFGITEKPQVRIADP